MYENFSLAPQGDQEKLLWEALRVSREVFNLALYERKKKGVEINSLMQAKAFAREKRDDPRLAILPYRTVEAILRQIDTYTMNKHCLPKFASADEWLAIPYKEGVKPIGDSLVWVPKIGEIEAVKIGAAPAFRSAWVLRENEAWKLRVKVS